MSSTERASPEALLGSFDNKPPPFYLNEKWFSLPKLKANHSPPPPKEIENTPQEDPVEMKANEIPIVMISSLTKEQKQLLHDQKMNAYGKARLILKKKPTLINSPWNPDKTK